MADFFQDSTSDKITERQPETSDKLKYELSKQALGLNGDIRLAFKSEETPDNDKSVSSTAFALHESLLDDEFDDVIDGPNESRNSTKIIEDFGQSSKPLVTQSKDINEINRIWNEKKRYIKSNEQLSPQIENMDARFGSDKGISDASTKSLAEQIAASKGELAYQYESRERTDLESGGFNSKAKMAAEMSLGLQNSTFVSTHGDSSRIVSPDNTPSTEVEAKRLQELQDLRAITNQGIPEKASSSDIKSENVSPSGDTKKGGVTQHEEAVTVNSSNDELQEIPKSTPNGAVTADVYLCSGPEMMTLFSDPGLSFLDIEPVVPLTGWKSVKRFMFGPPKLNRSLVRERDTIFALAKMPLDNASKLHTSMLQTVYLKLVVLEHNHLISRLFSLSHHETANFPLAVLSINFTKICLGVLRNEKMNKLCNARKQVIDPFNDLFVATWYHFDDMWNEESTISDIAYMLKDLENMIIENINNFLSFAKKLQSLSAVYRNENETSRVAVSKNETSGKGKDKLSRYAVGHESESNLGPSADNQGSSEFLDIQREKSSSNAELDFVGIEDIPGN